MMCLRLHCLILGSLLLPLRSSLAGKDHEIVQIARAQEAIQRSDCVATWNILWPLAKGGNYEARYYLYGAVTFRLIPPGIADAASWYRTLMTLGAYAAETPAMRDKTEFAPADSFARTEISAVIELLNLGDKGAQVAACYKSGSEFKSCLKLGTSLGVIPTFEDFAREIDAAASSTGEIPRCASRGP